MSKQTITFPIAIGDTVRCVVEDENHVTDIVRYGVRGLAFMDGNGTYMPTGDERLIFATELVGTEVDVLANTN